MYFQGAISVEPLVSGEAEGPPSGSILPHSQGLLSTQVYSENVGLGGPEAGGADAGQYLYRSVERLLPVSRELLGW